LGRYYSLGSIYANPFSADETDPLTILWYRSKIEETTVCDRIVFGTAQLEGEYTLAEAGLENECIVNALVDAEGGKRKRKKKVHTTPKKIKHTHKKRSKALLEYFSVEANGKVKKLKQECPNCPPATYMAEHPDRYVCGKCGRTFFRLTADGKRLPIPKNNKPAKPTVVSLAAKAAPAKAKKKKWYIYSSLFLTNHEA
jgi:ubiquitin-small subunit ribosomal protein S27Ae